MRLALTSLIVIASSLASSADEISPPSVSEATVQDMWCGTAMVAAFSPEGVQNYIDGGNALIERATHAFLGAGYTGEQLSAWKATLTDEVTKAIGGGGEGARYSFDECLPLANAAGASIEENAPITPSDTSPVKFQYFRGSRGQLKLQVQSVVDDVLIKDVVVNHGNCVPVIDFVSRRLRYGEVAELLFEQCSPLEAVAKTNYGDWTLTF